MAEPRLPEDLFTGFSGSRPKVCAGSCGSAQAGGQSAMRLVRLRDSPNCYHGVEKEA
ncbi:hypothetical protein [Thermoanaerobacterium sp. DL9XJH110]|uniref:hypothetical protein n=1 Tax=Thermoanaerobacterium sp. DL9XJH110 TaxID=3386643 RepID=UPI003BB720E0